MVLSQQPSQITVEGSFLTQSLDSSLDLAGVTDIIQQGEAKGKIVGVIEQQLHNWYAKHMTPGQIFDAISRDTIYHTVGRQSGEAAYTEWTDQDTSKFYRADVSTERVTRSINTQPFQAGFQTNFYHEFLENRKKEKFDPVAYGQGLWEFIFMKLADDRLKHTAGLCMDAVYTLAGASTIFTSSDNMVDFTYMPQGSVWSPATKGTTVFNKDTHFYGTPVAGTENDILINPATLVSLFERVTGEAKYAGAVFYCDYNMDPVLKAIRKDYPEYFNSDYYSPVDTNGIVPSRPIESFMGVPIVKMDDLYRGNRSYGNDATDTRFIMEAAVDSRNVAGFFLTPESRSNIKVATWFDDYRTDDNIMGDQYLYTYAIDPMDMTTNARGHIAVVESYYYLESNEHVRGAITY